MNEDFSFGFDTNQDILDVLNIDESADRSNNIQKLYVQFTKGSWEERNNRRRARRNLDDTLNYQGSYDTTYSGTREGVNEGLQGYKGQ